MNMKAKTLLELIAVSSSLYQLSQNKELMEQLKTMADKGKDRVNRVVNDPIVDEDGNELAFIDKMIYKADQAKDNLENKVEKIVAELYKKMNIAHLDEIKALKSQLEESDKALALLEARINKLENK